MFMINRIDLVAGNKWKSSVVCKTCLRDCLFVKILLANTLKINLKVSLFCIKSLREKTNVFKRHLSVHSSVQTVPHNLSLCIATLGRHFDSALCTFWTFFFFVDFRLLLKRLGHVGVAFCQISFFGVRTVKTALFCKFWELSRMVVWVCNYFPWPNWIASFWQLFFY